MQTGPVEKFGATLQDRLQHSDDKNVRAKLAKALGVSPSSISHYVSGATKPKFEHLLEIAEFFGMSLDELVFGEPSESSGGKAAAAPSAYTDGMLHDLQDRVYQHSQTVQRIGAALAKQIDEAARQTMYRPPSPAGFLDQDELLELEGYSKETWILVEPADSSGQSVDYGGLRRPFLHKMASNLKSGRSYVVIFGMSDPVRCAAAAAQVRGALRELQANDRHLRLMRARSPRSGHAVIHRLEMQPLEEDAPELFEKVQPLTSANGRFGYIPPANRDVSGGIVMDEGHREAWWNGLRYLARHAAIKVPVEKGP